MEKAIVIGCPGSGKTTFALKLAEKIGLPLFHLDAIWHKPDKEHIPREEFDEKLREILTLHEWIIDGNYSRTMERRLAACDTVFFFDLPTAVCLLGASARLGNERRDIPWCDTELDPEFKRSIEAFATEQRPKIYELFDKYRRGINTVIFKTRAEADEYLNKVTF